MICINCPSGFGLTSLYWPGQSTFGGKVHLLTREIATQALDMAHGSIWGMMDYGLAVEHLHIIVALRDATPTARLYNLLAERSFGKRQDWALPYDDKAHDMVRLTARTGQWLSQVQVGSMQHNDVLASGGSVIYGDVIAACASNDSDFDEAVANMIAVLCLALMQKRRLALQANAKGITLNS